MRIAIDYTPALTEKAGIGRFARGLVGGLAAVDRENAYTLLAPRGAALPGGSSLPPNFHLRYLPLSARWMTIAWQRLRLPLPVEVFAGPCDLFHSLSFVLPPVARARALVTIHDLSFLVHPECAEPGLARYLSRAVPAAVQRADLVLADSASTREDVLRFLGAPPARVAVVYGGVEATFAPVRDPQVLGAVRARYRLDSPFIFAVGTLEPRKNLGRLMEAYRLLAAGGGPAPKLLIAGGRGWLYEDLLRQAAATEGVRLLGFVPDVDLPALLSLADLYVYPSLYEGFGLPVLEAMACGTPVVASNRSSVPEVAGAAAVLVDPTDVAGLAAAMAQVLADQALRQRLVAAGRAQAARFTWETAARRLLEVYGSLGEARRQRNDNG